MNFNNWRTSVTWAVLLILDWATLPCKLLVTLPKILFFSPENESVVCFTRLSSVRSRANRLRIRSKQLCSQGSCERSSEKSGRRKKLIIFCALEKSIFFFIISSKRTTCKPSDAIWSRLCETAKSRFVKNRILIGYKLEISTWSYLWMFFTKKRVEQEKKKTSSLKKNQTEKNQRIPESNSGPLDWNAGANHSDT